jgi:hypothetical protein
VQVALQPVVGQRDAEMPPRLDVGDTARNVSVPRLRAQPPSSPTTPGMVVVGETEVVVGDVVVVEVVVGDVVDGCAVDGAPGSVVVVPVDGDVVFVTALPDPPPATVVVGAVPPGGGVP